MKYFIIVPASIVVGLMLLVITLFGTLFFARIGLYFLEPKPTARAVTAKDVVGVWSFTADGKNTEVTMTFRPSGLFIQQISTVPPTIHVGRWSLHSSADLQLDDFLMKWGNDWKSSHAPWMLVDGDQRVVIFGGADDPDGWGPLKYLGPIP